MKTLTEVKIKDVCNDNAQCKDLILKFKSKANLMFPRVHNAITNGVMDLLLHEELMAMGSSASAIYVALAIYNYAQYNEKDIITNIIDRIFKLSNEINDNICSSMSNAREYFNSTIKLMVIYMNDRWAMSTLDCHDDITRYALFMGCVFTCGIFRASARLYNNDRPVKFGLEICAVTCLSLALTQIEDILTQGCYTSTKIEKYLNIIVKYLPYAINCPYSLYDNVIDIKFTKEETRDILSVLIKYGYLSKSDTIDPYQDLMSIY